MKQTKKFIFWMPVILVLLLIYYFSSADGLQSAGMSSQVTDKLVNIFTAIPLLDLNRDQEAFSVDLLHYIIRKTGHISVYAALALALAFALYQYRISSRHLILWSLSFGFFYACTDEIHQLFVFGRSGRFTDVLIDSAGMTLGILTFYFLLNFIHSLKGLKDERQD